MTILSTILSKLAAALTALAMTLGLVHAPMGVSPLSTTTAGLIPSATLTNTTLGAHGEFTDKNWSLGFTIRPEWNVNEILDASNKLHQMVVSGTQHVLFISKDEAIGLSGDLNYTTDFRSIAGKSVEVRTYTKPNAQYAYYQTFKIPESDGMYNFLIKSTVADTGVTDAFIKSIHTK